MAYSCYTFSFSNGTVVADGELLTIRAATALSSRASLIEILRFSISQRGTSTGQQLGVQWGSHASAFGTFVSATPAPHALGTVASAIAGSTSNAASSCGVNASANGAGTFTPIGTDGFNNLNGFLWVPTPEERIFVSMDQTFLVQIQGTPTTLTGWNAYMTFNEIS